MTCFDRDMLTPSRCPVHGPAIKRGAQRPFPPKASSPVPPEDAGLAKEVATPVGTEALRSPPSDGGERLGPNAGKRMSLRALGYLPDNPDALCPYCGADAPLIDRVQRCVGCEAVIHLDLDEWPNATKKLAHIQWRNAKQLVSLLEKEYGFGEKAFRSGKDNVGVEPWGLMGMKVREKGTEWPVYHLGKNAQAKEIDGKFEYITEETRSMVKELEAQGKLEVIGKSEGRLIIHGAGKRKDSC